jgi:hypothetical protein
MKTISSDAYRWHPGSNQRFPIGHGDWFCALVSVPIREIAMVISLPLEIYIWTKHGSLEIEWIAVSPNSTAPPPTTLTP